MKRLAISRGQGVVEARLVSPDGLNLFDEALSQALRDLAAGIGDADRVVVLRNAGRAFSAGLDLARGAGSLPSLASGMAEATLALGSLDVPLITVVDGAARGGAMGVIAVSDVVVASRRSSFAFSETRIGMAPLVMGELWRHKAPFGPLAGALLSGAVMDPDEARAAGVVHRVAEDPTVTASKQVGEVLRAAPAAVRATKRALSPFHDPEVVRAVRAASDRSRAVMDSAETKHGVTAFAERREPDWVATSGYLDPAFRDRQPAHAEIAALVERVRAEVGR